MRPEPRKEEGVSAPQEGEAASSPQEDARAPVILVADDEPVNLSLIKRRLEWEDYEVATAEDGGQAVEAAKRLLPDLIILDVMMPVLDGLQACRLIKEDPSTNDIPVIFLSALDDMDTKVSGLSLGANDYISKPFRVEELLARVAVAIRLKRERDRLRQSAEELRRRAEAASEMSVTDALTGLLNRYGLQRALQRELSEARQLRRPLSCLLIDIDYFKHVNDTHGHAAGDTALMQVARLLLDNIRRPAEVSDARRESERREDAGAPRADVVCRYGGEEFLVLAPETRLEGALALAEKVRHAATASASSRSRSRSASRSFTNPSPATTWSRAPTTRFTTPSSQGETASWPRTDATAFQLPKRERYSVEVMKALTISACP